MTGKLLLGIALLALLAGACGSARRAPPVGVIEEVSEPNVRLGRTVFDRKCHHCHPAGEAGLGFAINNKPLPAWLIRLQVRRGLGAMPAFPPSELSDAEIDAVTAYLRWLRQARPRPEALGR